jgi:hypothetical protein
MPWIGHATESKMKQSLSLFSLACLALLTLHCKPEPPEITPCFTVVADTFRDPREPVVFVNCSAGADSYFWQFGDGTTSTEASPAHTFAQVGTFDVRLTASLGDAQEIFIRRIRVDYPRFRKVRVLEMPVMDPSGSPWDHDGNGLNILVSITRSGDNVTYVSPVAYDLSLPYEFEVQGDLDINASWWTFELDCIRASRDTVDLVSRYYDGLIDSTVERFSVDSILWEIVMEGAEL